MVDIIIVTNKSVQEIDYQVKQLYDNTDEDAFNLIVTSQTSSAAANRNYGLDRSIHDIKIMLDDDIEGFYIGWLRDMLMPLNDPTIMLASVRLLTPYRQRAPMMGGDPLPFDDKIYDVLPCAYKGYKRVATACIAFRSNPLYFDEGFIGSGYEDTDYMNRLNEFFPDMRMVLNNRCKLIHRNVQQNQGGKFFDHNKAYYLSKYPDDQTVICQKDWVKPK